jgi:hypothetical protein
MSSTSSVLFTEEHRQKAFTHQTGENGDKDQAFFLKNSQVAIDYCFQIFKKYLEDKVQNPDTTARVF